MEIGEVGYSGGEIGQLIPRYKLNKDFFSQNYVQPNFNR